MFHSLRRALLFTWQNFWRNFWLSLVTVLIMVLTLFMVSLLAGVLFVADEAITSVQDQVDVTVYFEPETPDSVVRDIQKSLTEDTRVEAVTLISRAQALEEFRKQNANNPTLGEALDALEANPLGPSLVIKAKDLADYAVILRAFDAEEVARFIQDEGKDFEDTERVVERLSAITNRIRQVGLVLSAVFVLIAILVTVNTIRIAIYTHRDEIAIMKLVGATNGFIRAPFILESMLYALIGSVITTLLLLPILSFAEVWIGKFFAGYNFEIIALLSDHVLWIFLAQLVFAFFLSGLSAAIAVGRYLRV